MLTDRNDLTVCFHSGGGLKEWLQREALWIKHVVWFPFCVYIEYIKGKQFIQEFQRLNAVQLVGVCTCLTKCK